MGNISGSAVLGAEHPKVRDERLADLERLGAQVNWRKSVLTHSKHTRFLCMLVDSELCRFVVPPEEVVKLRAIVKDMVAKEDASVRELASVVGKVMSMQVAVPAVSAVASFSLMVIGTGQCGLQRLCSTSCSGLLIG